MSESLCDTRDAAELAAWIESARSGCADSFGRLAERCRGYLLLIANEQVGVDLRAKVAASDLVQQTFVQALRSFDRFHGQTEEELLAWLRRIMLHQVASAARTFRSTKKRLLGLEVPLDLMAFGLNNPESLVDQSPTPTQQAVLSERALALARALGQLPQDYRRAIELRSIAHQSFAEVGQALGRSAEAARKLWLRAIRLLQELLESSDDSR